MQNLIKRKPVWRVAVLHDLCAVGKAAMTNILPVLSVMGLETCPIPTMVLSTHTGGFGKPAARSLDGFPLEAVRHIRGCGLEFDALLIGYLGSMSCIEQVRECIPFFSSAKILLDPVMGDHGRYYSGFDEEYCRMLRTLIKECAVLKPNFTEACFLTGEPFSDSCSEEKLERIFGGLRNLGASEIVMTSVPLGEAEFGIAVCEEGQVTVCPEKKEGRAYPGTGDLFSAVLLGNLLRGAALLEASKKAHSFVAACIRESDRYAYDTKEGVLLEPMLGQLVSQKNGDRMARCPRE